MNATSEAARYQEILNGKIAEGTRSALATIEKIQNEVPTDRIVNTRAVDFDASDKGLVVVVDDERLMPSDYAIGQIAAKGAIPTDYLRSLTTKGAAPWQHELAAEVLRKHYRNRDAERMLSRSVNGQLRGWLSDRYRRLDARPLVDALIGELQKIGAVPYAGTATDTRVALKALMPEIIEPVPGEYLVLGLEWSNSDYGNGPHRLSQFALRVACLNGMTKDSVLREVHIGGRLTGDISYLRYALKALRDTVKGVLGPAAKTRLIEEIKGANHREYSSSQLRTVTKSLPVKTQKAVVDAFESQDVINMPAGNTAWRASNAISWLAKNADSETRLDLERLAGKIVA